MRARTSFRPMDAFRLQAVFVVNVSCVYAPPMYHLFICCHIYFFYSLHRALESTYVRTSVCVSYVYWTRIMQVSFINSRPRTHVSFYSQNVNLTHREEKAVVITEQQQPNVFESLNENNEKKKQQPSEERKSYNPISPALTQYVVM